MKHRITDWTDAYTNGAHIPEGGRWPAAWEPPAAAFRAEMAAADRARLALAYGPAPRNRLDLFLPAGAPRGLVVFVHGGYWMRLDKSYWSHLATGPLAHGFAVAIPSYTLCPQARIAGIGREVAAAIALAAGEIEGPVHLAGHSAGGQLVARMGTTDGPLDPTLRARIAHIVSISGLHDLRPLRLTDMNATLALDEAEARAESPALLAPIEGLAVTAWVGGAERAEFRRQSALLANIWLGLGAVTESVVEPDRHHFDVVDGLADPAHALTRTLLQG